MHGTILEPAKPNRNHISVVPGKCVSVEAVAGSSQSRKMKKMLGLYNWSDETNSSETKPDSSSDRDFQEEADAKSVDCALEEVKIGSKILGQWIIVGFKKEFLLGNVDVVSGGEVKVCCLQKPLKIREPSEMEPESYTVFYKKVFKCGKHLLCRVGQKQLYVVD